MVKIKIKHPQYSLICCDLSAAEVRTSANASQDPDMIAAYRAGQDLYSLIASKAYNNNYEDNLEFYPEGTKIMLEGKEHICGNEKEYIEECKENKFIIPYFRLVNTKEGFIAACDLNLKNTLITDEGEYPIKSIDKLNDSIILKI